MPRDSIKNIVINERVTNYYNRIPKQLRRGVVKTEGNNLHINNISRQLFYGVLLSSCVNITGIRIFFFKAKKKHSRRHYKQTRSSNKRPNKKQDGLSRGSLHKWVFSCILKVSLVSTS